MPDFTLGYFLKVEKLDVTRVPYKDVVQAATDLSAGQIQFLLSSYAILRGRPGVGPDQGPRDRRPSTIFVGAGHSDRS